MDTNLMPKNADIFYCECCDFKCCKQSNYSTHLLTAKHAKRYNMIQNDTKKMPKIATSQYMCECGRIFSYHSGLWRHKKKCKDNKDDEELEKLVSEHNGPTDKELMMMLIKDNSEMKKMMMEVIKNGTHNTNNSQVISTCRN
jgi:hypothetical protein